MSQDNNKTTASACDNTSDASQSTILINQNVNKQVAVDNNSTATKTYSQTIQNAPKYLSNTHEYFPTKDQAIILPSMPEITVEEYIKGIASHVTPKNIVYAQKISNHRMCIFLNSKETVDQLLSNVNTITIHNIELPIRKLVTPAKKIIITGGSPVIPHIVIEKCLIENNIKIVSGVTFMRTNIKDPLFSHIQMFNRQFYANMIDEEKIPDTILVNYDDENYRLFLNINGTCYKCKQEGHIVKECPLNNRNMDQNDILVPTTLPLTITNDTPIINKPLEKIINKKRAITASTSSQSEADAVVDRQTISTVKPQLEKERTKSKKIKTKTKPNTPIEEQMNPLESIMNESPDQYILTYDQLKTYISETKGSKNINEVTSKYTLQKNQVIDMLRKLYPELKQRNIKGRFTKIIKFLEERSDASSPTSSSDEEEQT